VVDTGADGTENKFQFIVRHTSVFPLRAQDVFVDHAQIGSAVRENFTNARSAGVGSTAAVARPQHQGSVPQVYSTELDGGERRQVDVREIKAAAVREIEQFEVRGREREGDRPVSTCDPHFEVESTECGQAVDDAVQGRL